MVRLAVDRSDVMFGELRLELLCDELFPVVEVHLSRNSSLSEGALQGVYRLLRALVLVCPGPYPVARSVVREAGDVDLSHVRYAKLERVALPHRVDAVPLESLRGLGLRLDP